VHDAVDVRDDDVAPARTGTRLEQELQDGGPGRARA